jgi:hypothetical protein
MTVAGKVRKLPMLRAHEFRMTSSRKFKARVHAFRIARAPILDAPRLTNFDESRNKLYDVGPTASAAIKEAIRGYYAVSDDVTAVGRALASAWLVPFIQCLSSAHPRQAHSRWPRP